MPDDLSKEFWREMVKMKHPRWSKDELQAYCAWRDGNDPRVWDHIVRIWRTLRERRSKA